MNTATATAVASSLEELLRAAVPMLHRGCPSRRTLGLSCYVSACELHMQCCGLQPALSPLSCHLGALSVPESSNKGSSLGVCPGPFLWPLTGLEEGTGSLEDLLGELQHGAPGPSAAVVQCDALLARLRVLSEASARASYWCPLTGSLEERGASSVDAQVSGMRAEQEGLTRHLLGLLQTLSGAKHDHSPGQGDGTIPLLCRGCAAADLLSRAARDMDAWAAASDESGRTFMCCLLVERSQPAVVKAARHPLLAAGILEAFAVLLSLGCAPDSPKAAAAALKQLKGGHLSGEDKAKKRRAAGTQQQEGAEEQGPALSLLGLLDRLLGSALLPATEASSAAAALLLPALVTADQAACSSGGAATAAAARSALAAMIPLAVGVPPREAVDNGPSKKRKRDTEDATTSGLLAHLSESVGLIESPVSTLSDLEMVLPAAYLTFKPCRASRGQPWQQ